MALQFKTQPSPWNGNTKLDRGILVDHKVYKLNEDPLAWLERYANIPEPELAEELKTAQELPPEFFRIYRPVVMDNLEFYTYDLKDFEEFQDFVLKVLLKRQPLPKSFMVHQFNPVKSKKVLVQDFLKKGELAFSSINQTLGEAIDGNEFYLYNYHKGNLCENILAQKKSSETLRIIKTMPLNSSVPTFTSELSKAFESIFLSEEEKEKKSFEVIGSLVNGEVYYPYDGNHPMDNPNNFNEFMDYKTPQDSWDPTRVTPQSDLLFPTCYNFLFKDLKQVEENIAEWLEIAGLNPNEPFYAVIQDNNSIDICEQEVGIKERCIFIHFSEEGLQLDKMNGLFNGKPLIQYGSASDLLLEITDSLPIVMDNQVSDDNYGFFPDMYHDNPEVDPAALVHDDWAYKGHYGGDQVQGATAETESAVKSLDTCQNLQELQETRGHSIITKKEELWNTKNKSTNILSQKKVKNAISKWLAKPITTALSDTFDTFLVCNLKIAKNEIYQYCQRNNLPQSLVQTLTNKLLEQSVSEYLEQIGTIPKPDKGEVRFRVRFKDFEGYSEEATNLRMEFEAYGYPEYSSTLSLIFLRIGPRKEFYKNKTNSSFQSPKIYVDMDGVLCDFELMFTSHTGEDPDLLEPTELWELVDKIPNFWSDMPWMPDGKKLWEAVLPYNPTILSAPAKNPRCIPEKKEWVKNNLGEVPSIFETQKEKYAEEGAILIDDKPENIEKWNQAGGIGILYTSTEDALEQLQQALTNTNIVEAGISPVLYHLTSLEKVSSILKENQFRLTTDRGTISDRETRKEWFYFSTSRALGNRFQKFLGGLSSILVLDGVALGQRYAGGSKDYWQAGPGQSETEDRIWSKNPEIPNASKYIKEIHVYVPKKNDWMEKSFWRDQLRNVLIESKKNKIPIFIYNTEEDFRILNKNKSIDPMSLPLSGGEKIEEWKGSSRDSKKFDNLLELLQKPVDQKLTKEAKKLLYDLDYSDAFQSIDADIHNYRTKHSANLNKLLKLMKTLNLPTSKELINFIKNKYQDVTLAEVVETSIGHYYHGTNSISAERILKEGFDPNPQKKVWDESSSLESYYGTYFTNNLLTAISSGRRAVEKNGGEIAIFEVEIEKTEGLFDEDEFPSPLRSMDKSSGFLINDYYAKHYLKDPNEAVQEYVSKAAERYLQKDLPESLFYKEDFFSFTKEEKQKLFPLVVELIWAQIEQIAGFGRDSQKKIYAYRKALDQIIRALKGMPEIVERRNIRMLEGGIKITSLTHLPNYIKHSSEEPYVLKPIQGEPSSDFLNQFDSSIGGKRVLAFEKDLFDNKRQIGYTEERGYLWENYQKKGPKSLGGWKSTNLSSMPKQKKITNILSTMKMSNELILATKPTKVLSHIISKYLGWEKLKLPQLVLKEGQEINSDIEKEIQEFNSAINNKEVSIYKHSKLSFETSLAINGYFRIRLLSKEPLLRLLVKGKYFKPSQKFILDSVVSFRIKDDATYNDFVADVENEKKTKSNSGWYSWTPDPAYPSGEHPMDNPEVNVYSPMDINPKGIRWPTGRQAMEWPTLVEPIHAQAIDNMHQINYNNSEESLWIQKNDLVQTSWQEGSNHWKITKEKSTEKSSQTLGGLKNCTETILATSSLIIKKFSHSKTKIILPPPIYEGVRNQSLEALEKEYNEIKELFNSNSLSKFDIVPVTSYSSKTKYAITGAFRLKLKDGNFRIFILGKYNRNTKTLFIQDVDSIRLRYEGTYKDFKKDIKSNLVQAPEFFFKRDGLNDYQHSYKGSDKFVFNIGQYRTGHPYTNLPHKIKFYYEKFGEPDFIHVISKKNSPAMSAIYAEKDTNMIRLWSFVNIRQEPIWKAFEKAAYDAGYKIQDFHQGRVKDSHGYWLEDKKSETVLAAGHIEWQEVFKEFMKIEGLKSTFGLNKIFLQFQDYEWEIADLPVEKLKWGGIDFNKPLVTEGYKTPSKEFDETIYNTITNKEKNKEKLTPEEAQFRDSWGDEFYAREYAKLSTQPPPIICVVDSDGNYKLWNGRHRVRAAILNNKKTIRGFIGTPILDENIPDDYEAVSQYLKANYQDEGFVGEFWGSQASGILFKCGEKILLLERSASVEDPGLWGIPGGAVPVDREGNPKDVKQSALDEVGEELGGIPPYKDTNKKVVFKKGSFKYTTFLFEVSKEFTPKLNWEHDDFKWFDLKELPSDIHPGVTWALPKLLI